MNDEELQTKLALDYHEQGRPGKIEVNPTKPCLTARDLSLAYTPGVAKPCLAIANNPHDAYKYTAKGNLVAVISNGTAVLGLGNIGPLAGKPVMEGKGVLFKRFADIDVFDIEVNESSVEGMVKVVKALEPTFGGINLEDIKAPECFEIERILKEQMNIPVFHDDQHGTAIIASAAFLNALEVTQRSLDSVKVVVNGAGAAAIACANLFIQLGVNRKNLMMCDSKGVIYKGRTEGMNKYKESFALETTCKTLNDAMKGADVFLGCSVKGALTKEMVVHMAPNPIIFAMANPEPEIYPHDVFEVRPDAIMATGRSDFPNQVNNVLGFPFIFRGALDVQATKITDEMKLAAVYALSALAKEEVPVEVRNAYESQDFTFGKNYLIPKPFDNRVLVRVSSAVAKAAMTSGVARQTIVDFQEYAMMLERRLGPSAEFSKLLRDKVTAKVNRIGRKIKIGFVDGGNSRVIQTANELISEGSFSPILIGEDSEIQKRIHQLGLEKMMDQLTIVDPRVTQLGTHINKEIYAWGQRDGLTHYDTQQLLKQREYYGAMMLKHDMVDVLIAGPTRAFTNYYGPMVHLLNEDRGIKAAGVYILVYRGKVLFLADCAVHVDPTPEQLLYITSSTVELYQQMMKKSPAVAVLSFSNFGSSRHPMAKKMRRAVGMIKKKHPDLMIDGEMQADVAVNENIIKNLFSFSDLKRSADVLIFPCLSSANITYKLLVQLSDADVFGPILVPLSRPANIVQRTATVTEIINMSLLTASLIP